MVLLVELRSFGPGIGALFFFLTDPAPPEFSTFPLHAALPICLRLFSSFDCTGVCLRAFPARVELGCERRRRRSVCAGLLASENRTPTAPLATQLHPRRERDRKSTRLNSSHRYNSVARLCFEKK